jgi:hypothetical protein
MPWTVPAGTPNHSCLFAVVNSTAEPESDPMALNWVQLGDMSHVDNDWAQRSLDIGLVSASNTSNLVESAPFVVRFANDAGIEQLPVRLAVRAAGEMPLAALRIDAAGKTTRLDPRKAEHPQFRATAACRRGAFGRAPRRVTGELRDLRLHGLSSIRRSGRRRSSGSE